MAGVKERSHKRRGRLIVQGIEGNQSRTEEKPKLKKPLKKMGVERWQGGVKIRGEILNPRQCKG